MGEVIVDEVAETVTFEDVTVTFPYGFTSQSKVGTITISGANGVSNILIGLSGSAGLPPDITIIGHVVPYDEDLPATNPTKTILDPGGPGEASSIQYDLYVHGGEPGDAGTFAILDGTDLTGTATAQYMLVVNDAADGVEFAAQKVGDLYWPGTSIDATTLNNLTPRPLKTITVPARPFAWRPVVWAQTSVTGSVDTRIDLIAYLGNPDSGGVEVGRGNGTAGAAPPTVTMIPAPPPTSDQATYAKVAVNTAATIYLRAVNQGNASANWSTPGTPQTTMTVQVVPVT